MCSEFSMERDYAIGDQGIREEDFKAFKAAVYAPREESRQVLLCNSPFLPCSVFSEPWEYLANIELALGERVTAEESSHYVQFDQPELVIEAINHVPEADRISDLIQ
jgi:hypothetical protein